LLAQVKSVLRKHKKRPELSSTMKLLSFHWARGINKVETKNPTLSLQVRVVKPEIDSHKYHASIKI
jgi:ribosomal protein L31E